MRRNFQANEFYTLKMRKSQLCLQAIKQRQCIIISNLVLYWSKLNKMYKFFNSYEESLH